MNILRLIKIRVNPKLCRSRSDIAHSSKDGLFHHVSEISRQFQLAGAFDHVHFHFQCRAADACPGKTRDETHLIRLRHFIGQETARTEEFLKVAARDGQPLWRVFLHKAHGALAAHGGKLPFERAHAGLSGVAGDDFADGIVCEPDVRFCDAVLGKLLGKQMALGNLQLFFVGIRPQFDDLHAVEQRSGDGVGGVGSRDEHALAQVKRHFDIVVAEARILRRIEDLQKRRRGVALVVAAELVNFVEQQKRVLALCLRDAGHDSAGHGADVGFAVPADFRFVMDAAERDARKPAVQRPRDGDRN